MGKCMQIQTQINTVETFVAARAHIITQPEQALAMCTDLLAALPSNGLDIQHGIRIGDVYALLVSP